MALAALAGSVASVPLAAGALIAARPFPRAAFRYRIVAAGFVLAAGVAPVALVLASVRAAPPALAAGPGAAAGLAVFAAPLVALAAAVSTLLLLWLALDVVRLRRVKQQAVPLGRLFVRRARIGTSQTVGTPTAIGYLHPAVVVPEGFRDRVDAGEWEAVLAHECAHLERRDDWAKAVQSAVLRAGWWLPGLWVLGRALDLERELASDEHAAVATGPRRYAACLLRLATTRPAGAVAPAFGGRRSHVAIRVERLLRPVADGGVVVRSAALGAFTAAAFAVVALAVLAVPGTRERTLAASPQAPVATIGQAEPPARQARLPASAAEARPAPAPSELRTAATVLAAAPPLRPAARPAFAPPQPAAVPLRRTETRMPPSRREAVSFDTFAVAMTHRRCRTCFGPLRSPEEAVVVQGSAPAGLAGGAASAIAADEAEAGSVSLNAQLIWFRFPARVIQAPPAP